MSGASSSITQLMIPVGLLIATPVTEVIGISAWFIFAELFSLLIVLISSFNQELIKYSFRGEKLDIE